MRPLTLAALTPTALTAASVNAILSGYDSSGSGLVARGFSDPITAVFPHN